MRGASAANAIGARKGEAGHSGAALKQAPAIPFSVALALSSLLVSVQAVGDRAQAAADRGPEAERIPWFAR